MQGFFLRHPIADRISWNQYSPYFNDGDTCYFEVRSYTAKINDVDDYNISTSDPNYAVLDLALKELISILDMLPTEMLEDTYGDHATITVTRDGKVTVEECCDHD